MKQINPYFLAGYFDCDGSFQLQINVRKSSSGKENIRINPRAVIAFKDGKERREVLEDIRVYVGGGQIYISNEGKVNAKVSWMTTNVEDCLKVAKIVVDLLYQKGRQARGFIEVCNMIKGGKNRRSGINMYGGQKIYSKEEMIKMVKIAITLNEGMQMNRWRESQSRDIDHYLQKIEEIYSN